MGRVAGACLALLGGRRVGFENWRLRNTPYTPDRYRIQPTMYSLPTATLSLPATPPTPPPLRRAANPPPHNTNWRINIKV